MKKALIYTTALVALGSASVAHAGGDAVAVAPKKAATKKAANKDTKTKKATKKGEHAYAAKSSLASAGGLAVTVGGELDSSIASVNGDDTVKLNGTNKETVIYNGEEFKKAQNIVITNDSKINVKAEGKTDTGLTYGGVVELQADVSDSKNDGGVNAEKTYIFLDSSAGKVEFGATEGAAQRLEVNAGSVATISGGVGKEGNLEYYVPLAGFITKAQTALDFVGTKAENANKIAYYSPKVEGFQAGLSYTPDSGDAGTADATSGDNGGFFNFKNIFTGAIKYANEFDGVGVEVSIGGEFGSAEDLNDTGAGASLANTTNTSALTVDNFFGYDATEFGSGFNIASVKDQEDLQAFNGGLKVSYEGFSLAGSYTDLGKTGDLKDTAGRTFKANGSIYSVGAGYSQKDFALSAGYVASELYKNEFTNISVGADYKLAPGFVPYAEVNIFDAQYDKKAQSVNADNASDNKGTVITLGTKLSF
jgi:hypothetical protein